MTRAAPAPASAPSAPMPHSLAPMLASAGAYPADERGWAFELKWDGARTIAFLENGRLTLRSRNEIDVTARYPELAELATRLKDHRAVLDGEVVALDDAGRPSFQRLQARLGADAALARRRAEDTPVVYVLFDVLHLDGHDLAGLPYRERRALLEALDLQSDHVMVTPAQVGDGRALMDLPGWEGIVAKRLDSRYEPGARSRAWIKMRVHRRQELVVGGWSAGRGGRSGSIGALLLGYHDVPGGRLLYAGSVGTGFDDAELARLLRLLKPDVRATSPFATPVDKEGVTFVEPRHVAEIEFTEWTREGSLRHPSYKGLREDKDPREVVREET